VRRVFFFLLTAAVVVAQQRSFVACPIVRDTKTVPCFLAEYEGETYFLGIQQDITSAFRPPQLKHEVLVEGTVVYGPRVCGGIALNPIAISVIKEVNLNCNTLLPAEPGIDAPPATRGAGPSSRRPEEPQRPTYTGSHEFTIPFQFNDDTPDYAAIGAINDAGAYAKRINASSVRIAGYRATTLLSDGNRLVEKAGLAEKRAMNIKTLLDGLSVQRISVEWKDEAELGDGKSDPGRRRVTILVTP
jgi:outer membrane protein OmpA-like peptidoglycan-associated protein